MNGPEIKLLQSNKYEQTLVFERNSKDRQAVRDVVSGKPRRWLVR
jgi:hypothetical protein